MSLKINFVTFFKNYKNMHYTELFKKITTRGSRLCYPFDYSQSRMDYLDYVDSVVDEYLQLVSKLDHESITTLNNAYSKTRTRSAIALPLDVIDDAHKVAKMVRKVLTKCFSCYYDDAYILLEEFFTTYDYHYYKLLPVYRYFSDGNELYRMRSDKGNINLDNYQGELFHIPYHLRHLVSTQRYSIPGYPVLYLAGSFLTAWCELDKPSLKDVVYSKMRFKEEKQFIDLAYPLSPNPQLWEYYSLFAFYPLMIACMVQVKYPNAPFKPEYCLPQQMLNLVRSVKSGNNVGIVYMSNKSPDSTNIFSPTCRNFAVVIRDTLHSKGYDVGLANKMVMTPPVSFSDKDIVRLYGECNLYELTREKEYNLSYNDIILSQE